MNNKEYKEFLKYVFNEYIQPRIHRISRYCGHPEMWHHWSYEWQSLKRAIALVNYINNYCNDTNDIYMTFTLKRLREAIDEAKAGLRWHNELAEDLGFFDAIDAYFDEIVDGLDVELFPESEYELFKELGSRNPKSDLQGIIYVLKTRKKKSSFLINEISVSKNLKNTVKKLSEAEEQFEENEKNAENSKNKPKKSRRWFKGLGQIGQGTALSIGDIALATDILKFPVPPEVKTWGSLVSTTTGIGMVLNGIGELRGE